MSSDPDHIEAHRGCTNHREAVLASDKCACFYCCSFFPPSEINEWVDPATDDMQGGTTALCPRCGIDAVLPMRPGIDLAFLQRMHAYWFLK